MVISWEQDFDRTQNQSPHFTDSEIVPTDLPSIEKTANNGTNQVRQNAKKLEVKRF